MSREYRFVDEVTLTVAGGDGGNGCVAFRRAKFEPMGGPSGGDGGRGGSVIFEATEQLSTLLDLRYRARIEAKRGENGRNKDQYGRSGDDTIVTVPAGTQVYDVESGALIVDLDTPGTRFVAAAGGAGGRGNIHFATSTNRAPRRADPGRPGEVRKLRLELKVLADVGLVGFPNAGKSTLISVLSRAKPKIADYPFTTLTPNLGVVSVGAEQHFVVADIPGLVEGAAEGQGLGHVFLRHIERTALIAYVLAPASAGPDDLQAQLDILKAELERYDPDLAQRPHLIVVNKEDILAPSTPIPPGAITVSAATQANLDTLTQRLWAAIEAHRPTPQERSDAESRDDVLV